MTKTPPHFSVGNPPSADVIPFKQDAKPQPNPPVALSEDGEFTGVIDMLYALIEDLESMNPKHLPTGIFVGMYKDNAEEGFEHFPYYNHGLTRIELLGVLTQFMRSVL